ncbi:MAG: nickel pincer cofactor biosynthesis protein LarC [Victivallales bacterium]|nr:nickel pincer cofactor biosynthesis protein LarC [Victivallales bacterium]
MKIIRFDSVGGASGDMILGALIGLGVNIDELNHELRQLIPDSFLIKTEPFQSHGINNGIRAKVEIHEHKHHHEHEHHNHHEHTHGRSFSDIQHLLGHCNLPPVVKEMSLKVFRSLAEAEGKVHNVPVEKVHFHEVGAVDSIVDITGCCLAFHKLGADAISVSPLPTGTGTFECQHGIYPLPAPATLEMLKTGGLCSAPVDEPFELLTPTGAALLAVWPKSEIAADARIIASADSFGQRTLNRRPNLLRAALYESANRKSGLKLQKLTVLETNIDDSSPELTAYVFDKLLEAGALDVWIQPVLMKKQRQGILLSVLCAPEDKTEMMDLILTETSTLGIREYAVNRYALKRRIEEKITPYGKVRIKVAYSANRELNRSPEYADCVKLAQKHKLPLKEIMRQAMTD